MGHQNHLIFSGQTFDGLSRPNFLVMSIGIINVDETLFERKIAEIFLYLYCSGFDSDSCFITIITDL
jgi:hypothetical protein